MPHDISATPDCHSVYVVEIGPNNLYKFENSNIRLAPRSREGDLILTSPVEAQLTESGSAGAQPAIPKDISSNTTSAMNSTMDMLNTSNTLAMGLLAVPLLCVIVYAFYASCRKEGSMSYFSPSKFSLWRSKRSDHFDLGRLLSDPEKSGFNRVAMDESDFDGEVQSDSEVEEFSVHNIKSARKV
jgi:hypothetical protein